MAGEDSGKGGEYKSEHNGFKMSVSHPNTPVVKVKGVRAAQREHTGDLKISSRTENFGGKPMPRLRGEIPRKR